MNLGESQNQVFNLSGEFFLIFILLINDEKQSSAFSFKLQLQMFQASLILLELLFLCFEIIVFLNQTCRRLEQCQNK